MRRPFNFWRLIELLVISFLVTNDLLFSVIKAYVYKMYFVLIFQVFSGASDIDKLGPLSYSIVGGGGNCSNIFRMDKVTGMLFINNTENCLDHDISPVHTLLIEARDGMIYRK